MNLWSPIGAELRDDGTAFLFAGLVLTWLLLRLRRVEERPRVRAMTFFTTLHAVAAVAAGPFRGDATMAYRDLHLVAMAFAAVATVAMAGAVLFVAVLPRARLHAPRILQDVLVATAALAAVFIVASRNGFNLSSLIATSAVITAVVGFSLQDTLGNIAGGLALQLDNSVGIGDWIKVGDLSGQVADIRWRYTAVQTRNWETLLIPNSVLMKGQVTVLGRRGGQPLQLRRWVWFNVDYRFPPSDVLRVVTEAFQGCEIPNVAAQPAPNCVLMELGDSFGRYAVRYWLTELLLDDPTDSRIRTRLYFALKRAGITLSIPAQAVFVTEESEDRKHHKEADDFAKRQMAIHCVELFAHVSDEERERLARALRPAPFSDGEIMTRQGAEAHWLYVIVHGKAAVRVAHEPGLVKEVAQLGDGDFFGEMSLMTGEPRSATVVARTDVDCYRLDKAAFQTVIQARPELAEHMAGVLAHRRVELAAAVENLDHEARARRLAADKVDLLAKIRAFFSLDERAPS
jgi:small-conductance mechanosensitive channel/CRP-like cAMP-binding protein